MSYTPDFHPSGDLKSLEEHEQELAGILNARGSRWSDQHFVSLAIKAVAAAALCLIRHARRRDERPNTES